MKSIASLGAGLLGLLVLMTSPSPIRGEAPPPLALDRKALFARLMAQEAAEGSTVDHLSFLDRGLASGPFVKDAPAVTTRLAVADGSGAPSPSARPMPAAGIMPESIDEGPFHHFDPALHGACVAVCTLGDDGPRVAWYGRRALANVQFWSSTKILQAFNLVSLANEKHPALSLADMDLRPLNAASPSVPFPLLMRRIVSYEKGVWYSNAGSEALGRFLLREHREARVEEHTGHDCSFRGAYGAGSLIERPMLRTRDGEIVATAPAALGSTGPNLVSPYDLCRMTAMAAWHMHLGKEQRISGAQWHSLSPVLLAMAHDSARYLDVAFRELGLLGKVDEIVAATKLGFGISSASKKAQLTYVGVLQFRDRRVSPPVVRRACFALRGEHGSAVRLDAQMAVEVTDLLRLVADGRL